MQLTLDQPLVTGQKVIRECSSEDSMTLLLVLEACTSSAGLATPRAASMWASQSSRAPHQGVHKGYLSFSDIPWETAGGFPSKGPYME